MAGLSSRTLLGLVSASGCRIGSKLGYRDLGEVQRKVARQQSHPRAHHPPGSTRRRCHVTRTDAYGWPVYQVSPRRAAPSAEVLYLHGGAYIEEIGSNHWRLIRQLATDAAARVTVPVFPLAPRGRADRLLPDLAALADTVVERGRGGTVFMGDSAGGALAMALAQRRRDAERRPPGELVLISPWLDAALDDPLIPEVQPLDPMLAAEPLRYAGELWAGPLDLRDARVSPLRGSMRGLPPITVFTGTRDILLADARRLRDLAEPAGVTVRYVESPGQIHAYPLWPVLEARDAHRKIIDRRTYQ